MFERLKSDIRCVLERDPAARSGFEVFLCYPGFHAVRNHRTAHFLHTHGMKMLARAISQLSRFFTGIRDSPRRNHRQAAVYRPWYGRGYR